MEVTRDIITLFVSRKIELEETLERLDAIALETSTEERVVCTRILTELYYDRNGMYPPEKYLIQMADYIMADELKAFNKPDKEHSVLSSRQFETIERNEDQFGSSNRSYQSATDERYSIRI